ncbi:MAG: hypothetical protein HFJ52_00175 [Clostridia bacterium]|nr:hypothetical protein [Clostridia bacterium]
MDNEEEKKVDTQTTEKVEDTNANESTKTEESGQKEEQKQEENSNIDANAEEDIANAFGNTTGKNKNEGDKGKKANSVAQTNADGSITFKSQEELDGFIRRMYRKGATASEQKTNETKTEELKSEETTENKEGQVAVQNNEEHSEKTQVDTEGLMAKIALAMIDADINAKKARKAARLVDVNKVITDGNIDEAKLKEEIDEIVAEWPELKAEITAETVNKGFAFGGSQENNNANSEDAEISKIFGNS